MKLIVFDWDGTLADSTTTIVKALLRHLLLHEWLGLTVGKAREHIRVEQDDQPLSRFDDSIDD